MFLIPMFKDTILLLFAQSHTAIFNTKIDKIDTISDKI